MPGRRRRGPPTKPLQTHRRWVDLQVLHCSLLHQPHWLGPAREGLVEAAAAMDSPHGPLTRRRSKASAIGSSQVSRHTDHLGSGTTD